MRVLLTKLELLIDILEKKKEVLHTILALTENQSTLLEQPSSIEILQAFKEVSDEKQKWIEEVLTLDTVFNRTFSKIEGFEEEAHAYKETIIKLQKLVEQVTDVDIKIRVIEQKNNAWVLKQSSDQQKKDILSQYQKFSKENIE